jgi:hypothetical protein
MPKRKNRKVKVSKPLPPEVLKKITSGRQLAAVKKISELLGNSKGQKNITLGKILKSVGYSDSVCKTPTVVTKAKGFQELLKERLSDDLLTQTHQQLLQASKLDHYVFPKSESDAVIKEVINSVPGCKFYRIRRAENWKS